MRKRAVIYIRESTNFQDPESQYQECLAFCEKNDFEVIKKYQDIASGKSNTRKEFLQMQQDMEDDLFDIVVLWELSRSTRDFITYKLMIQRMFELNIELYSLQEGKLTEDNIDNEFSNDIRALVNSHERKRVSRRVKFRKQYAKSQGIWTGGVAPLGYKLINSELVINEEENSHERKRVSRRVKFRKQYAKSQGIWTGGVAPLGYKLINSELVINEEEAPKVKEIFQLYIEGNSYAAIAKKFGFQDSKKIMRMLANPIYIGKLKQNETEMINDKRVYHSDYKTVQGKHEPIISEEIFNLCAVIRKSNPKTPYSKNNFILKNVIDYNGQRMYPCIKSNQKSYYSGRNGNSYISAEYLEKTVIKELTEEINKFTILDDVNTQHENILNRKVFYSAELSKLKNKEEKLLRLYLNDNISEEKFNTLIDEVKSSMKNYEKQLEELSALEKQQINSKNNCQLLQEYLIRLQNTSDRESLKKLLNAIIFEIRLINDFRVIVITNLF